MPLRLSPSSKYCLALGGIAGGLFIASWGWTEGQPVEAVQDADGTQRATIKVESYSYTPNHLVVRRRLGTKDQAQSLLLVGRTS